MPDCPNCGSRMRYDDETTKIREFACAVCHTRRVVRKGPARLGA